MAPNGSQIALRRRCDFDGSDDARQNRPPLLPQGGNRRSTQGALSTTRRQICALQRRSQGSTWMPTWRICWMTMQRLRTNTSSVERCQCSRMGFNGDSGASSGAPPIGTRRARALHGAAKGGHLGQRQAAETLQDTGRAYARASSRPDAASAKQTPQGMEPRSYLVAPSCRKGHGKCPCSNFRHQCAVTEYGKARGNYGKAFGKGRGCERQACSEHVGKGRHNGTDGGSAAMPMTIAAHRQHMADSGYDSSSQLAE